ncbi:hypothetical protein D3C74_261750 [compost metagenome]
MQHKTFKTIDDVLAYYGWGGDKEGKEDESKLPQNVSGTSKDRQSTRNTGQDEEGLPG